MDPQEEREVTPLGRESRGGGGFSRLTRRKTISLNLKDGATEKKKYEGFRSLQNEWGRSILLARRRLFQGGSRGKRAITWMLERWLNFLEMNSGSSRENPGK